jgi:hypothetical protein
MDSKADEQRVKLTQKALLRLATGEPCTRSQLFNDPPSPEGKKPNWQFRVLDHLASQGVIAKLDPAISTNGVVSPSDRYEVTVEAFERLEQIGKDNLLTARLLWPGRLGSPLEDFKPAVGDYAPNFDETYDEPAPAAAKPLDKPNGASAPDPIVAAAAAASLPAQKPPAQVAPGPVAEPASVAAPDLARLKLPKLTSDEFAALTTVEATMLKLVAAILENDIYIRTKVDRTERKVDEMLEILRKLT